MAPSLKANDKNWCRGGEVGGGWAGRGRGTRSGDDEAEEEGVNGEERGGTSDPAATVAKSTDVAASHESKTHVHEQAHGLRGENPANAYANLRKGGTWFSFGETPSPHLFSPTL